MKVIKPTKKMLALIKAKREEHKKLRKDDTENKGDN